MYPDRVHLEVLTDDSAPSTLRSAYAVHAANWREAMADLDPPPLRAWVARLCSTSDCARRCVTARQDGSIVGVGSVELFLADNRHLAQLRVDVDATSRRRGVGTALVRALGAEAASSGRRTAVAEAAEGSPGEAFAHALGAATEQVELRSSLDLGTLRTALVRRLLVDAAAASPGYELLSWVDTCPTEVVHAFADVREVMSTAPLGGLDVGRLRWDADRVRESERRHGATGGHRYVVVARRRGGRDLAGYTEVLTFEDHAVTAHQGDTAVDPRHRGHRLGLRMKAAMLLWLLEDEPDLRLVTTWNALGNEHMLGINHVLGFRPQERWSELQVPVPLLLDPPRPSPRRALRTVPGL